MSSNALAYLEDYLDTFEALPIEVTKQMTLLKELGKKRCRLTGRVEVKILTTDVILFVDSKCKSH